MKLSFSTRGWQQLGWEELLDSARESGLNGIELYDLHKREDLTQRGAPFDKYSASATARQLRDLFPLICHVHILHLLFL